MPKRKRTRTRFLLAAGTVAFAGCSPLAAQPECKFEAERTASIDAVGAQLLEVRARAGELTVEGVPGASAVTVHGRACASSEALLEDIRLSAERRGSTVRVEALMPERGWFRRSYAILDLRLEAPAGIAADVVDSSGAMALARLGALTVDDSSGAMVIEDVAGPLRIVDSSGGIEVMGVRGDVEIDDSSGDIELRDVEGSVQLRDSSGGISARGVGGSVTVQHDSSGSIHVADVGGDFVVERDSSGGVTYRDVRGNVRVPGRD